MWRDLRKSSSQTTRVLPFFLRKRLAPRQVAVRDFPGALFVISRYTTDTTCSIVRSGHLYIVCASRCRAPYFCRFIVVILGAPMAPHQPDSHLLRLYAHSDDLRRRSAEANQQLERVSSKLKHLFINDALLRDHVNKLLNQTTPFHYL